VDKEIGKPFEEKKPSEKDIEAQPAQPAAEKAMGESNESKAAAL